MDYRRLGSSGLKLSALSLGSWVTFSSALDEKGARECMAAAFASGVNYFDNAESYGRGESERLMGRVLKRLGWSRDSYCVSSKVFFGPMDHPLPTQRGLSRKHLMDACDQSLERLQLEYLDLYFCHRPDPETPVAEIVWTLHNLVCRGKIRYWGTSEWPAAVIAEALAFARENHLIGPQMEQPQYNLFARERVEVEYAPLCSEHGLGLTTWSPLASGVLTGKYLGSASENARLSQPGFAWLRESVLGSAPGERLATVARLTEIARDLGLTPGQLAIAWCLKNPQVSTVITGATDVGQVVENMMAIESLPRLTEAVLDTIDTTLAGAG